MTNRLLYLPSAALSAESAQRYSEMKGTLQYMPPEVLI